MKLNLAYGRDGLQIDIPDSTDVLEPKHLPGLLNTQEELVKSLRHPIQSKPLKDLASPECSVAIVHSDITRATPNHKILPPILNELHLAGVSRQNITLINGLGTHRQQTEAETRALLGDNIVDTYRCLQHDTDDKKNLMTIQIESGKEFQINRHYLEADIRILTGLIEPHFFAGFSGGPKSVLPAIAGTGSIHKNHGPAMLCHPNASWGITAGNPLWEELFKVAKLSKPTFILNVTLNANHEITGVFSGDLSEAHSQGCTFVKESVMVKVDHPYDIVLTTNSGYPLDQNLYQSVKGVCAAENITKEGGSIIIATACADGLPDGGNYAKLLSESNSTTDLLDRFSQSEHVVQEQWQVQKQINVQQKADVYVFSGGLTNDQIRNALFTPCQNIEDTINELILTHGAQAKICALPQGPQTIPYLELNN